MICEKMHEYFGYGFLHSTPQCKKLDLTFYSLNFVSRSEKGSTWLFTLIASPLPRKRKVNLAIYTPSLNC